MLDQCSKLFDYTSNRTILNVHLHLSIIEIIQVMSLLVDCVFLASHYNAHVVYGITAKQTCFIVTHSEVCNLLEMTYNLEIGHSVVCTNSCPEFQKVLVPGSISTDSTFKYLLYFESQDTFDTWLSGKICYNIGVLLPVRRMDTTSKGTLPLWSCQLYSHKYFATNSMYTDHPAWPLVHAPRVHSQWSWRHIHFLSRTEHSCPTK